jgi:hypothetical protein
MTETPLSANLAPTFNLPVALVIDRQGHGADLWRPRARA